MVALELCRETLLEEAWREAAEPVQRLRDENDPGIREGWRIKRTDNPNQPTDGSGISAILSEYSAGIGMDCNG